jgi:sulfur-oxidizing protein SoxY
MFGDAERRHSRAQEMRKMGHALNRRQTLAISMAALAAAALPQLGARAFAAVGDVEELIKKFTGGKRPMQGRVRLDLPEIAENGNTVPMTVSVESPMTAESYVSDVLVVADRNPRAGVVSFHFSPASGVAEASTRIRLSETQNVIAVAKMSDGTFYTATKEVKVTIGGCSG